MMKTSIPQRQQGQRSVLSLTCAPIETVRIGLVGLGRRGQAAVRRFAQIDGTRVTALCDADEQRMDECEQLLPQGNGKPHRYAGEDGFQLLCKDGEVDLIYICTDWQTHVPIALCAMSHGRHVAIEVPAAITLEGIWQLIDAAEQHQVHCMMLENCVYDTFEMATLGMARQGLFGDIVHVEGGYAHPIGEKWTPWRLEINRRQRGDVYPTHGVGPLCQLLDIHRSDRLAYLVSMDSAPFSGPDIWQHYTGTAAPDFQNGDQTSTLIRTERGRTMLIQHNVMTPRPYSRMHEIVGTKGYARKYPAEELFIDGKEVDKDALARFLPDYVEPLLPLARQLDDRGGMAYFMDWRLIHCLRNGLPLDMDVYDMAEWCCLAELSRLSIENGSAPVEIPDFLRHTPCDPFKKNTKKMLVSE